MELRYRFTCEQTPANIERADAIYEEHIRQLLDSAYTGFGVIELMVGLDAFKLEMEIRLTMCRR